MVRNYANTYFKVFLPCPILLDILLLLHKFCPRLWLIPLKHRCTHQLDEYFKESWSYCIQVNECKIMSFIMIGPNKMVKITKIFPIHRRTYNVEERRFWFFFLPYISVYSFNLFNVSVLMFPFINILSNKLRGSKNNDNNNNTRI